MLYFRQCTLVKDTTVQVAWIPEQYATEGKHVKFKDGPDWDDHWLVQKASDRRQSEDYLMKHERDYLSQRRASDI